MGNEPSVESRCDSVVPQKVRGMTADTMQLSFDSSDASRKHSAEELRWNEWEVDALLRATRARLEGVEEEPLQEENLPDELREISTKASACDSTMHRGHCFESQGRLEDALRCYQECQQDAQLTVAASGRVMYKAGVVRWKLGQYNEALLELRQACARITDCVDLAQVHLYLGKVHRSQGHRKQARRSYERAFTLLYRMGEEEMQHNGPAQKVYVDVLQAYGSLPGLDFDFARQLLLDALAIQYELVGDDHVDVASTLLCLGSLYEKSRLHSEAALLLLHF